MKKANFILTVVATLAVAFITASFAGAQPLTIQEPGDGIVTTGKVALSKGAYKTFTFGAASGVTATTTQTVSGTIANLSVSGQGLIATVSTTVTGTLDKKTIVKGKVSNKELLQLILNTTDKDALKGQTLVLVAPGGGVTDGYVVGAVNLKDPSPTVKTRELAVNPLGVDGYSYLSFLTSIVQDRKDPSYKSATGYGGAYVKVRAAVSVYGQSLIAQVKNLDFSVENSATVKETYKQNADGQVIDSSKGTLTPKNTAGWIEESPTP